MKPVGISSSFGHPRGALQHQFVRGQVGYRWERCIGFLSLVVVMANRLLRPAITIQRVVNRYNRLYQT